MLSVIIPSYNEEQMIEKTATRITKILTDESILFELIFVDDGSKDKTWEKVLEVSSHLPSIRGVHFSRNFGKESAILAGLTQAKGDCCVVIDCDLQHPPEKMVDMFRLWEKGYEVIEGRKIDRGTESRVHTFAAKTFYEIVNVATGYDMANASDFKLLDRKVVNVLVNMREKKAFFRALSSWVGFKTAYVEFCVQKREVGETKWSTSALVKYALSNISSFSTAPMQMVTIFGIVMLIISTVLGAIALIQKFVGQAVAGFTTVILIQLFTGSILMISLGIIGYYIARIYEEIKDRPRYIIAETCGEVEE